MHNYGTGDTVPFEKWENMYLVVPYVDKRSHRKDQIIDDSAEILVLAHQAQCGSTVYLRGSVSEQPASMRNPVEDDTHYYDDGGTIGITEIPAPMPLFKILESKVVGRFERLKIPMVIRKVPVIGSKYADRIQNPRPPRKPPSNNVDSGRNDVNAGGPPVRLPRMARTFLQRLPREPWADWHFQGSAH